MVLAGPWNCGIGIFTPTILAAAVGTNEDHARSIADLIAKDVTAAKGAALIATLLIVGCQPRSR